MAKLVKCTNCSGTGRVAHYAHIDNGICYVCQGTGKVNSASEKAMPQHEIVWLLKCQMDTCGKFSEAEVDANWDWYIAKRVVGADQERFIEAFRNSLAKRGVKPNL